MATEVDAVVEEIRQADKLLLTTHENPDGDALGSLLAMHWVLKQIGKDSLMYMSPDEFPLPYEYRDLTFDDMVGAPPDDIEERVVVFLDCGNIDRNPADMLKRDGMHIVNIDHHHDNTRFGTVNHVVPEASCTAEIVWDLMRGLGVEPTPTIAEALYVGLVTDTGKFMYENTGTRAHVMAAELIEAGVDVHEIYRRLYENIPFGKLTLLARSLACIERYDDGRLTVTQLTAADYEAAGAEETYSEGVVDHLRSVDGTLVAALVRDVLGGAPANGTPVKRKVSLRATEDRIDVSQIARSAGGGGHRQAAGFTTELEWPELVEFLRGELRAQL